jgi:hypothetical protein
LSFIFFLPFSSYQSISLVSFHFVSISLISFRFVSFSLISFRCVSFSLISFRFVSFLFRFALYRYPRRTIGLSDYSYGPVLRVLENWPEKIWLSISFLLLNIIDSNFGQLEISVYTLQKNKKNIKKYRVLVSIFTCTSTWPVFVYKS